MTSAVITRPVLADRVPRVTARDVLLVIAGALLVAATAQIIIPLPVTPVPITGQTFGVLLVGAALGPARGASALLLYLMLGLVGLPFYAGGESGWQAATGATGGYLVGFIVAAWLVGQLARRGFDRKPWSTAVAFIVGSLIIYAFGVPWLAVTAEMSMVDALRNGAVPFLIGDGIKALLAAGLLPLAWRGVGEGRSGQ